MSSTAKSTGNSELINKMITELEMLTTELKSKIDIVKEGTAITTKISPLVRYLKVMKVKSPIVAKAKKLLEDWEDVLEDASLEDEDEDEE
jgi:hypothetical protein